MQNCKTYRVLLEGLKIHFLQIKVFTGTNQCLQNHNWNCNSVQFNLYWSRCRRFPKMRYGMICIHGQHICSASIFQHRQCYVMQNSICPLVHQQSLRKWRCIAFAGWNKQGDVTYIYFLSAASNPFPCTLRWRRPEMLPCTCDVWNSRGNMSEAKGRGFEIWSK